jgi:hypothetical protein
MVEIEQLKEIEINFDKHDGKLWYIPLKEIIVAFRQKLRIEVTLLVI